MLSSLSRLLQHLLIVGNAHRGGLRLVVDSRLDALMHTEAMIFCCVAVLAQVGGEDRASRPANLVVAPLVEGADIGVREADVNLAIRTFIRTRS